MVDPKTARFMELWQSSLDDGSAFIMRCAMRLTPAEFEHVKEFMALALRALERNVEKEVRNG